MEGWKLASYVSCLGGVWDDLFVPCFFLLFFWWPIQKGYLESRWNLLGLCCFTVPLLSCISPSRDGHDGWWLAHPQSGVCKIHLGGWVFTEFFYVHPWGRSPIWAYFSNGLLQPLTSHIDGGILRSQPIEDQLEGHPNGASLVMAPWIGKNNDPMIHTHFSLNLWLGRKVKVFSQLWDQLAFLGEGGNQEIFPLGRRIVWKRLVHWKPPFSRGFSSFRHPSVKFQALYRSESKLNCIKYNNDKTEAKKTCLPCNSFFGRTQLRSHHLTPDVATFLKAVLKVKFTQTIGTCCTAEVCTSHSWILDMLYIHIESTTITSQ